LDFAGVFYVSFGKVLFSGSENMYGLWADPTVKHHHENAKNKKKYPIFTR